ncbi:MAG TPA: hypothetical protein VHU88_12240 [Sporichthyaceae bacterium]|jgi:hypothetical protein|nr:hypothetical protein [Sporichthyaceae bacterium]
MSSERIAFLVIGLVVVVVVGRLIINSGRSYVAAAGSSGRSAASAASLVAVLFHLATLGLVALIAVLPLGGAAPQRVLIRVGILLVVVAAVYGVMLALLNRRREEAMAVELDVPQQRDVGEVAHGTPTDARVEPRPTLSPDPNRHR